MPALRFQNQVLIALPHCFGLQGDVLAVPRPTHLDAISSPAPLGCQQEQTHESSSSDEHASVGTDVHVWHDRLSLIETQQLSTRWRVTWQGATVGWSWTCSRLSSRWCLRWRLAGRPGGDRSASLVCPSFYMAADTGRWMAAASVKFPALERLPKVAKSWKWSLLAESKTKFRDFRSQKMFEKEL